MTGELKGILVHSEKDSEGRNTGWLLKINYADFKKHGYETDVMWLEKIGQEARPATAESVENTFRDERSKVYED